MLPTRSPIHALGVTLALVFFTRSAPAAVASGPAPARERPNLVYILCDDLGFGDVRCLNPAAKIPTPGADRLAAEGMVFTDAHSSSSVCTPTRYSILTGRYNWRSRLKSGVLWGYSRRLIEPGRLTVPSLLKRHGYATACVGKWHLGMDWPLKGGGLAERDADGWKVDYGRPIGNGPNAVGFDHYFGISASLDMTPYVFIRNDRVAEVPTRDEEFWPGRKGPAGETFRPVEVLPRLTEAAVAYVEGRAGSEQPFFLYLPLASPHTPIVPGPAWGGRSGINAYADFVMQTDDAVGRVLEALDRAGLADDTLVMLTSDNGCSPEAKFRELRAKGHDPSGGFRGHKADLFEGGHRVPLIVRWPGKVKAGTVSGRLTCLTDLMATCADLLGEELPDDAGEDSVSLMPALRGEADRAPGGASREASREAVVHHSINGSFGIRRGHWKLLLCGDSGGWSPPRPGRVGAKDLAPVQLYDLSADPGERVNVHDKHPDVVAELTALLEKYVADGRSTPGKPQKNTDEVRIGR